MSISKYLLSIQPPTGQEEQLPLGTLQTWGSLDLTGRPDAGTNLDYTGFTYTGSPGPVGNLSWKQIGFGEEHAIGLRYDDTLWAWGRNTYGEMGLDKSYYEIGGSWSQIAISSGGGFTLGIRTNGTLWSWGNNNNGQLGLGDTTNRSSPVQIGTSSWIAVSAGSSHVLAIRSDNTLWSWGSNNNGQLGSGTAPATLPTRSSPVQVGTSSWTFVNAFNNFSHAITTTNQLFGWGFNNWGQVGDSSRTHRSAPQSISAIATPGDGSSNLTNSWTSVSAGASNVVALQNNGYIATWGANTNDTLTTFYAPDQLNYGTFSRSRPVLITTDNTFNSSDIGSWTLVRARTAGRHYGIRANTLVDTNFASTLPIAQSNVVNVTTINGGDTTFILDSSGNLYSAGASSNGVRGDGDPASSSEGFYGRIATNINYIPDVKEDHMAAIDSSGSLFMWGQNSSGELGRNNQTNFSHFAQVAAISSPVQIGIGSSWKSVSVGQRHNLAIRSDNKLFGWGRDSLGQLATPNGRDVLALPTQIGTANYKRVAAGREHSLAIGSDDKLYAWGSESLGQVSSSDFTPNSPIIFFSSEGNNDYQIRSDNTLWVVGPNNFGQYGDGTTTSNTNPVQIPGSWTSVSTYRSKVVATKTDGTLWHWGQNLNSISDTVHRSSPVQVPNSEGQSWTQVRLYDSGVNFVDNTGRLWGMSPFDSVLGAGVGVSNTSSPVLVSSATSWTLRQSGTNINRPYAVLNQVLYRWGIESTGNFNRANPIDGTIYYSPVPTVSANNNVFYADVFITYGLNSDKTISAVGFNTNGELGDNTRTHRSFDVTVQVSTGGNLSNISVIGRNSASGSMNAMDESGGVYVWGPHGSGAASYPTWTSNITNVHRSRATLVTGSPSTIPNPAYNYFLNVTNHIVRTSNNQLFIYTFSPQIAPFRSAGGRNLDQGLALNPYYFNVHRSTPTQISTSNFTSISTSNNHSLAIDTDRKLWSWGSNSRGQVGVGRSSTTAWGPNLIGSSSWTQVSAGSEHSLGVDVNGNLYGWGNNDSGQAPTIGLSQPLIQANQSWSMVSAGDRSGGHILAIRSDGRLFGWGRNQVGQLGLSDVVTRSFPVSIDAGPWSVVSASKGQWQTSSVLGFTVGIKSNGTIWGWGHNSSGQLGLSDTIHRSSPVQIGTSSWTSVSCGTFFTVAIRNDGTLWAWGNNDNGQLGQNNTTNISSPVQIGSDTNWESVSAGASHVAAIRTNKTLWIWGRGSSGEIGDGTTVSKSSPVQIPGSWIFAHAGQFQTWAIRTDETLWAWGNNGFGDYVTYLGDGTAVAKSSPVQIGAGELWKSVFAINQAGSVGNVPNIRSVFAVNKNGSLWVWGSLPFEFINFGIRQVANSIIPVRITQQFRLGENIGGISFKSVTGTSQFSDPSFYNFGVQALTEDGRIFTAGYDERTGLGQTFSKLVDIRTNVGNTTTSTSPRIIDFSSYTQVGTKGSTSLALRSNGVAIGFGTNSFAQIGTLQYNGLPASWSQISSGYSHSLAIRSDGGLFAWGDPRSGRLGLGRIEHLGEIYDDRGSPTTEETTVASPVQIGLSSWTQIYSGASHSLAIRFGGSLFAWGNNGNNQLGTGDASTQLSPVNVGGSLSWAQIAAGDVHSAAIQNTGALYTWGSNGAGQVGSDLGTPFTWTAVSIKKDHVLALRSDGALYAWGENNSHQVDPAGATFSWTNLAVGDLHTLAIRNDGALFAWGNNGSGQLGDGTLVSKSSAVQIGTSSWIQVAASGTASYAIRSNGDLFAWGLGFLGNSRSWISIDAGRSFVAGVASDGTIWGWGTNTNGQIGADSSIPRQIDGDTNWSKVSCGGAFLLALKTNGESYHRGENTFGQDGSNSRNTSQNFWRQYQFFDGVSAFDNTFTDIAAGANTAYLVGTTTSRMVSCGQNSNGQIGDFTFIHRSQLVTVGGGSFGSGMRIFAGDSHAAAIRSDGVLWTWGLNGDGQLGLGNTNTVSNPQQVPGTWSTISLSRESSAAIRTDGTLWTWGNNSEGQLGDGSRTNRTSPVQVSGGGSWISVAAGRLATIAIKSGGGLFTWGVGTRLGVDTGGVSRSSPVQVGSSSWSIVAATHTAGTFEQGTWLARTASSGELHAYGAIAGDGTTGSKTPIEPVAAQLTSNSPVLINATGWTALSAGPNHILGIKSNGLYAWGLNGDGQLGDGTRSFRNAPVQIGSSNWTRVSAGTTHSAAIRSGGNLFTWGRNASGQIGDSTIVSKSSPVQIGTLTWNEVAAGSDFTAAILNTGGLFTWGNNGSNRLAATVAAPRSSPVQIGSSSWTQVKAYDLGGLIRRTDGVLFTWNGNAVPSGRNAATNLNNLLDFYSEPITYTGWGDFAVGISHAVASAPNASVLMTWGRNDFGQLGDGRFGVMDQTGGTTVTFAHPSNPIRPFVPSQSPVVIAGSWTSIAAGYDHSLGIRSDGTLWGWGYNIAGQAGRDGTTFIVSASPTQIATASWTSVFAGHQHSAAIRSDNTGWSWGRNTHGQLGHNNTTHRSSPVQIGTATNYTSFSLGGAHTMARNSSAQIFVWGRNNFGQLGDNTRTDRSSPVFLSNSDRFAAGYEHSVFSGSNGNGTTPQSGQWFSDARAVGRNAQAQLADGTTTPRSSPVFIRAWPGLSGEFSVTEGAQFLEAGPLSTAFRWYIFGSSYTPQAGIWITGRDGSNPSFDGFVVLDTLTHSRTSPYAVRSYQNVFLTFFGDPGQPVRNLSFSGNLDQVTTLNFISGRTSPTQLGTSSWTQVSAGNSFTLAIRSDGGLFAWGENNNGQLGLNDTTQRWSPVQIGASSWSQVSAGSSFTLAIRSDGRLFSWGLNNVGQLGDNSTTNKSSPVQIGSNTWTRITAGLAHSAAIRSDGALFTWGENDNGRLGQGATPGLNNNVSSPVQIGTSSWTNVSAGASHTQAIRSDGMLFVWGSSNSGILGVGNRDKTPINNQSSPVMVGNNLNQSTIHRSAPVIVGNTVNPTIFKTITAGTNNSAGIV